MNFAFTVNIGDRIMLKYRVSIHPRVEILDIVLPALDLSRPSHQH